MKKVNVYLSNDFSVREVIRDTVSVDSSIYICNNIGIDMKDSMPDTIYIPECVIVHTGEKIEETLITKVSWKIKDLKSIIKINILKIRYFFGFISEDKYDETILSMIGNEIPISIGKGAIEYDFINIVPLKVRLKRGTGIFAKLFRKISSS